MRLPGQSCSLRWRRSRRAKTLSKCMISLKLGIIWLPWFHATTHKSRILTNWSKLFPKTSTFEGTPTTSFTCCLRNMMQGICSLEWSLKLKPALRWLCIMPELRSKLRNNSKILFFPMKQISTTSRNDQMDSLESMEQFMRSPKMQLKANYCFQSQAKLMAREKLWTQFQWKLLSQQQTTNSVGQFQH